VSGTNAINLSDDDSQVRAAARVIGACA
jgi:hypothetical protein